MESDNYSESSEEKMLETDNIDYSQFLKPRSHPQIHIGANYQAKIDDLKINKNKKQLKDLNKFKDQLNKRRTRKMRKLKIKNKTIEKENINNNNSFNNNSKRRKIVDNS